MPEVVDSTTTSAPPEEVWKLLYDPARLAEWWIGLDHVEVDESGRVVFTRDDGFVSPQRIQTDHAAGRITISCLVLGVEFRWLLSPLPGGGTRITARWAVPAREAAQLGAQRAALDASLRRLAALAATGAPR